MVEKAAGAARAEILHRLDGSGRDRATGPALSVHSICHSTRDGKAVLSGEELAASSGRRAPPYAGGSWSDRIDQATASWRNSWRKTSISK